MTTTLAWDTETFRFEAGRMAPQVVCSSWQRDGETAKLMGAWLDAHWLQLADWLEAAARGELVIVGHNVAYDVACCMADMPELAPIFLAAYDANGVTDTMLIQKLLDIAAGQHRGFRHASTGHWQRQGYSLRDLSLRWLGEDMDKGSVRTGFGDLWGIDPPRWPDNAAKYARNDSRITHRVHVLQKSYDAERGGVLLVDQWHQARAALALHLIEVWGITTDRKGVQALHDRAEQCIAEILPSLQEAGLVRANSTRDMKAIYARMESAWPQCPRTPTGRVQVNSETCEESGDAMLLRLAEYQRLQNVLNKDCKELARGTVLPIHTRFDPIVDTGRCSSSGPNIQNVKRDVDIRRQDGTEIHMSIRECYVPRPGHLFLSCDYGQLELYTFAEVQYAIFGSSVMGEALRAGADPHMMVGANVLNMPYADAVARKHDPEVKDSRQHGKPTNFGLLGGMGAKGLLRYAKGAYGVDFTMEKAKRMIDVFHATWPDVQSYFDWVRDMVGEGGSTTVTHLYSGRQRGHIPYTAACNTFFQGLAADGAKDACYNVARLQYGAPDSPLYGTRTVNFVHDELLVEVPDDPELAHAAAMELQRVMIESFRPWVRHLTVKAEPALMRRWSKKAEPTWRDGMLIPWEDAA